LFHSLEEAQSILILFELAKAAVLVLNQGIGERNHMPDNLLVDCLGRISFRDLLLRLVKKSFDACFVLDRFVLAV
jgi:hypothetical protein